MPPINVFRGDAVPAAKIVRVGPPPVDQLDGRFEFSINGKTLVADGWSAAAIAAAWTASTVPEFAEVAATASGESLVLTGPADGTPFDVAVRATGYVEVTIVEDGRDPVDEIQRIAIPDATGGTWTLTHAGQTTAAIAHNATAETVRTALEALGNLAPGDVAVTGFAGGPWEIEFTGTLAAVEVAELSVDASGLTGIADLVAVETLREGTTSAPGDIDLWAPQGGMFGFAGGPATGVAPTTDAAEVKAFLDQATGAVWTVTGDTAGTGLHATSAGPPTVTLGAPVFTPQLEGGTGYASGTAGIAGITELQSVSLTSVGGGTFTLEHAGNVSAAIAWNASAADVKAALEALPTITTVDVTGTPGAIYYVQFVAPGGGTTELIADGTLLQAAGTVAEIVAHDAGAAAAQTVALPGEVTAGTFTLQHRGDSTVAIAFDATAAALEAALEGIESIGAGGVAVDGPAGGPWLVTWSAPGVQPEFDGDGDGLTIGTGELVSLAQAAAGPTHWHDPGNWTLGRPPESGDAVWLDQAGVDLLHSLRQRTGIALGDAEKDTLAADGALHFATGQKITLRTTDTLPGGLAPGDYFVADPDEQARTFKLAATRGGAPLDLTADVGSGTQTAVVELEELHVVSRFNGALGLPRRNALDYWEYRPTYLAIGFAAGGARRLRIGAGEGAGSGRLKIDAGADQVAVIVVQTGGAAESGVPSFQFLGDNPDTTFVQLDGESGLAVFPAEEATLLSLDVRGGRLLGGEGLTILGDVTARPGSVYGRYLDSAANEHRWE